MDEFQNVVVCINDPFVSIVDVGGEGGVRAPNVVGGTDLVEHRLGFLGELVDEVTEFGEVVVETEGVGGGDGLEGGGEGGEVVVEVFH